MKKEKRGGLLMRKFVSRDVRICSVGDDKSMSWRNATELRCTHTNRVA